jgi:hypothetical protein
MCRGRGQMEADEQVLSRLDAPGGCVADPLLSSRRGGLLRAAEGEVPYGAGFGRAAPRLDGDVRDDDAQRLGAVAVGECDPRVGAGDAAVHHHADGLVLEGGPPVVMLGDQALPPGVGRHRVCRPHGGSGQGKHGEARHQGACAACARALRATGELPMNGHGLLSPLVVSPPVR